MTNTKPLSSLARRLAAGLQRWFRDLEDFRRNRDHVLSNLHRVSGFSDYYLRDIGLSRSEIHDAITSGKTPAARLAAVSA